MVLRDANGEQELSQPYAASVRRLGLSHPYQASAEEVQARYGATLEAMPPRPVSHVLYFVSGADQLTEASMVELDTVRRLLAERPAAKGLTLPGMPAGSPGMEMPDGRIDPYTVELVNPDGSTRPFSRHGKTGS